MKLPDFNLTMANYTKKALVNVGKVFVISIVAAFFGYLARIFFARNLTVEEFGLFYAIIAFLDRKSTRLNSSHITISYAVFCL